MNSKRIFAANMARRATRGLKGFSSDDDEEEEEPPKPVSSAEEDESDDDDDDDDESATSNDQKIQAAPPPTTSRLFAPYRSVGVVTDGRFHLVPNQSSEQAFVACPIGDRFQLLQTGKLNPVLVSHSLPNATIRSVVTDPTLSITVAAYGKPGSHPDRIALFQRTRVLETLSIAAGSRQQWHIVDMVSMGRVKQAVKNGKNETENAAVIAVLLKKREENDIHATVPTMGEDSDGSNDDDDEMEIDGDDSIGEIVLIVAMRRGMRIRSRLQLSSLRPSIGLHPATYVNKLLVGGDNGATLVNIRSGNVVHTLTCLPTTSSCVVTAMEQAPAVDTVAIGTADGAVHLVNLRVDNLLFTLTHKNLPITSLSFRTDSSALHYGISPLAVGCGDGNIIVWDLNRNEAGTRNVLCEMEGQARQVQYFPQEPLLLVAGENTLQMFLFDQPDHQARLLRQRIGHSKPPCLVRYRQQSRIATAMDGTDAASCQIISTGGLDRTLRMFSTARSVLDREFSQGPGLEKHAKQWKMDRSELLLPRTTAVALSDDVREWGNLVTIHEHHAMAYVWSTHTHAQSGPVLRQNEWNIGGKHRQPPRSAHATAVTLSACANFALVGTQGGTIYKYNIQSGLPRGSYPEGGDDDGTNAEKKKNAKVIGGIHRTTRELEKKLKVFSKPADLDRKMADAQEWNQRQRVLEAKAKAACHDGFAVTGLAVDSMNKVLISVGSDGKLIVWHFRSHRHHSKSPFLLPCGATKLVHMQESDLAAIALDDFSVVLFDCSSLSIVRRFGKAHAQTISDMAFSQDGRVLFTSSLDSTVKVFDVPTNACVDWLSFASPPTALAVSPTGEFLATTHVGNLGISVWSDKSYYKTVHYAGVPLTSPIRMDEPAPVSERSPAVTEDQPVEEGGHDGDRKDKVVVPKESGLITLSGLPVTHWKNLFHLDLVKLRNQPKEPPKKPPSAPFFLQSRMSSSAAVSSNDVKDKSEKDEDWDAAWSDDDNDNDDASVPAKPTVTSTKRRKVSISRSHLATLLEEAPLEKSEIDSYHSVVTDYFGTLGPSAIDVELSSLCHGSHDLEDGLPLLLAACQWLTAACKSHDRFEAVNAYLNRFLHLHASIISSISHDFDPGNPPEEQELNTADEVMQRRELLSSLRELSRVQTAAVAQAKEKLEHTLCLLRHFSRIV